MTKKEVDIKSPFTGGKVVEISDVEEKKFRADRFTVNVRYYQCVDTSEQFTTAEQDEMWTEELYSKYRLKHGIPSPDEIKSMREGYGLSYAQLSRLLGFGINQLKSYEKGRVPSESNGKMLKMISEPLTMMNLLEISRNEFSAAEYDRIKAKIALKYLDETRLRTQRQ